LVEHTAQQPVTGWKRDLVLFTDRQIYHLSRHWLAVFVFLVGLYIALPTLAPVLMAKGAPEVGRWIYVLYRPACHQLPERSFFLFGAKPAYTLDELWALGAVSRTDDIFVRQRFIGTPEVGFKVAICERDVALYGGMFLASIVFGLVRKRLKSLSLLIFGLCLLPMAIDGGTQLIFLRESTWLLRVLTGGLAGAASVWLVYPHLERAFAEVRQQANERVHIE
jgi:uncharacterized membrane protein